MSSISVRAASTLTDDGLRLLQNFDSQLTWLKTIGSGAQWGDSARSDQEDTQAKYRTKVQRSEREWNEPWSRHSVRAYVAEVETKRGDLPDDLLELGIERNGSAIRLPVAGMVLEGSSSDYVRSVLPENDEEDPFIYVQYLLTDRRTTPYNKGAGAVLIAHAKEEARRLGIRRLCLDCWRGNDNKLAQYYKRQGFITIGDFEEQNWQGTVMEMRF